jgi:hypothetical protein
MNFYDLGGVRSLKIWLKQATRGKIYLQIFTFLYLLTNSVQIFKKL